MECRLDGRLLVISITDFGCGIENIEQARQPFFTTDADGKDREWVSQLWKRLWMMLTLCQNAI